MKLKKANEMEITLYIKLIYALPSQRTLQQTSKVNKRFALWFFDSMTVTNLQKYLCLWDKNNNQGKSKSIVFSNKIPHQKNITDTPIKLDSEIIFCI